VDAHLSIWLHLKEITPYTRLIHSELLLEIGTTLESELRKDYHQIKLIY
jgi:hypothetical protein